VLSSGTLFSSDYRYLTDAAEGAVIRAHIMPILNGDWKITPSSYQKISQKDYYDSWGGKLTCLRRKYVQVVRAIDNVSPFFVLSFCKHTEGSQEYNHACLVSARVTRQRADLRSRKAVKMFLESTKLTIDVRLFRNSLQTIIKSKLALTDSLMVCEMFIMAGF